MRAPLAEGQEVNLTDSAGGATGLMAAAVSGQGAVVELLLQQPGIDVNLTIEGNCETALHFACYAGHAGIVRKLLAHPSLTCQNAVAGIGNTQLFIAMIKNHVECVRELVAVEGVDLEIPNFDEMGLEELARGFGSHEALRVLREERGRREVLEREKAKLNMTNVKISEMVQLLESSFPSRKTKKSKGKKEASKMKGAKSQNIQIKTDFYDPEKITENISTDLKLVTQEELTQNAIEEKLVNINYMLWQKQKTERS